MTELSELFAEATPDIQRAIQDLGWKNPTPVQAAAIPKMRAGGDLIVRAQTGSGKTGAFGIPIIESIDTSLAETQAIVLLPTRELANQVAAEVTQIGRYRGVRVLPIYGGVAYGPQNEGLEKGAHVVVGTPGRVLDHLKSGRMHLEHVKVLVLDEADEMLSLGFWPAMRDIEGFLPRKRRSHLFSATMPEKVRSLSRFFLTDAEDVTIDPDSTGPQLIEHYYYVCTASNKDALLARILEYEDPESAIIFCNTKADVRFVTGYLAKRGFNADQISGDLQQSAREKAMARIKAGELRFLVATDVAARGIDISDLAYVINYATSDSPEVYVHRTGRTGRAGKKGVAISLVSGLDIGNFNHMQVVLGISIKERKAPSDRDLERRARERAGSRIKTDWVAALARAEAVLAPLSEEEKTQRIEAVLGLVREAVQTDDGMREIASLCAASLVEPPGRARIEEPDLTLDGDRPAATASSTTATAEEPDEESARGDGAEDARPRSRRRRGRSGRGRRGGESGRDDGASRSGSGGRRSRRRSED